MAATQKDQYRKPMPGIWLEIERIFREEGVTIGMHDIRTWTFSSH
jgi:bifunctional polynucleotide phosphatase/kinase